jgi:hypothetical protein
VALLVGIGGPRVGLEEGLLVGWKDRGESTDVDLVESLSLSLNRNQRKVRESPTIEAMKTTNIRHAAATQSRDRLDKRPSPGSVSFSLSWLLSPES